MSSIHLFTRRRVAFTHTITRGEEDKVLLRLYLYQLDLVFTKKVIISKHNIMTSKCLKKFYQHETVTTYRVCKFR